MISTLNFFPQSFYFLPGDEHPSADPDSNDFRDNALMSPAEAVTVILDAVRNKTWRVLVGEDAKLFDQIVRGNPEDAYSPEFLQQLQDQMPSALKKEE